MLDSESLFVDSAYLIALRSIRDNWRDSALAASRELVPTRPLVISDGVIFETMAHFSRAPREFRVLLAEQFRAMKFDRVYTVIPHSAELTAAALDLYDGEFADSTFSLQDCAAIVIMREYGITSILTADQEFARAGFTPLLRRYL